MLKSTQDKLERQQKAQSQIEFFENQKENLKNMQCDSIEEIARKLEMSHSYEDQIAAVKKQYNNEQMFHDCKYKDAFVFKGGTSLSESYHVIERFSEDVVRIVPTII